MIIFIGCNIIVCFYFKIIIPKTLVARWIEHLHEEQKFWVEPLLSADINWGYDLCGILRVFFTFYLLLIHNNVI